MHVNDVKGMKSYNELNTSSRMLNKVNTSNSYKNFKEDTIEISNIGRTMIGAIDKGTAAHTTLYVDYPTYHKILSYTTNNPECQWSEMGIDDEKRWVVVNGQRFESPLSEEEKALRKRAQFTLLDYMEKHRRQKERLIPQRKEFEKIDIDVTSQSNTVDADIHPKIKNLFSNEKVMNMLKAISKSTGGIISLSPTL